MRRYILTIFFATIVIGLYHFIEIPLFNLDLLRRTREALFIIRMEPEVDTSIVLLNIGQLDPDELKPKIDSLLMLDPKVIGVNICHYDKLPKGLFKQYESVKKLVFANCGNKGNGILSQIIAERNTVTHFKTDKKEYFELLISNFYKRENREEIINYGPRQGAFYKGELRDSDWWFNPDYLKDKTVLLGYLGDYLTDTIYYFKKCRITPLNSYYGDNNIKPDMYDIDISAHIIRTINNDDYITEFNQIIRVSILLLFSLFNMIILTFIQTKWIFVNLTIALITFILLTMTGSWILVYLFDKKYFLDLDELPIILIFTTLFVVILNIREKKTSPQK